MSHVGWAQERRWVGVVLSAVVTLVLGLGIAVASAVHDATGSSAAGSLPEAQRFRPLQPFRLLDTRTDVGGHRGVLGAGETFDLHVAGRGGVPLQSGAVLVLNVTAVGAQRAGWLAVSSRDYDGTDLTTSTINYVTGAAISNAALTRQSTDGTITVHASTATHAVIDVTGYYPPGVGYSPVVPKRLLDTRSGLGAPAPSADGFEFPLAIPYSLVPRGSAKAVLLNVTVTAPTRAGFLNVVAKGQPTGTTSTIQYAKGQTVAGLVLAAIPDVPAEAVLTVAGSARTQVVADLVGYVQPDSDLATTAPQRLVDSRAGLGAPKGLRPAGSSLVLQLPPRTDGQATAGVLLNVTVTQPQKAGFVTVFPEGSPRPTTSSLNFATGQALSNAVLVRPDRSGKVVIYASAATHLVIDVRGEVTYSGSPPSVYTPFPQHGVVGRAFDEALNPSSGVPDLRTEVVAGALPPGLSLSANRVRGTPTAAGRFEATVKVTDQMGVSSTGVLRIIVVPGSGLGAPTSVSVGTLAACATSVAGGARCWGFNYQGVLGDGTINQHPVPVPVSGLESGVSDVAIGYVHACASMVNGTVRCWGWNRNGELGDGTKVDSRTPVTANLPVAASKVDVSFTSSCALATDQTVWCWGGTPKAVAGLAAVSDISLGYSSGCALVQDAPKCWGSNESGQLGDGTTTGRPGAAPVEGLASGVRRVEAGRRSACALLESGTVQCWGSNDVGQLGDGSGDEFRTTPAAVPGLTGVDLLAASDTSGYCAVSSGAVRCWGSFAGTGGPQQSATPVVVGVAFGSRVTALSIGPGNGCATTAADTVECWGRGEYGQLGALVQTDYSGTPLTVVGFP